MFDFVFDVPFYLGPRSVPYPTLPLFSRRKPIPRRYRLPNGRSGCASTIRYRRVALGAVLHVFRHPPVEILVGWPLARPT
jgi:hypothetical protein